MPTKINLHSISTAINIHVWLNRNTRPLNNAPNGWNIIICKRDTHRHIVCMIYLLFSWKKLNCYQNNKHAFARKQNEASPKVNVAFWESLSYASTKTFWLFIV